MTDQIREQVSALLDGELPGDEMGLLVRRLERDAELRRAFGNYALIGEALRAPGAPLASPSFAARVSAAIDAPAGATIDVPLQSTPARRAMTAVCNASPRSVRSREICTTGRMRGRKC